MKLGDYTPASDEELDELAEITDEDVIIAQEEWERRVPRWAKNILLADLPDGIFRDN